ncbi:MAG: carboxypeptidase regulatory-like domain-containing protein, partial [Deltaproteobacteria bacterium]|nr:carboxypeptidase regulatory-like domain-containing protein [Deltaproteobacteria bacterium]
MNTRAFVLLVPVAAFAISAAGCATSVDPTNPYDPSAASEQKAKGGVAGTVMLEGSTSAGGVTVLLKGTAYTTQTDAAGAFALKPVQPGRYTLVATPGASHEGVEQGGVEVGAGETVDVGDIFLRMLAGVLKGTVALKGGGAASGAVVSVVGVNQPSAIGHQLSAIGNRASGFGLQAAAADRCAGAVGGAGRTVIAGSDGSFAADRVPVGDYVVAATKDGYAPGLSSVVSVTKDGETTVRALELAPITSVIHLYGGAGKDNEKFSNTLEIKEEILAFNSSEMRVGKSKDLSGAAWETFSASREDSLSDVEGEQSIYFQFRDAYCRESPVYEAGIVYDATAPVDGTVEVEGAKDAGGRKFTSAQSVTLRLSAEDELSGVEQMVVAADGVLEGKVAVEYETRRSDSLTAGDGKKAVLVKFIDGAGNGSEAVPAEVYLDTTGPTGTVAARGVDASGWLTSRSLDLLLSADDGADGSGAAEMMISEDAAFAGAAWERFAPVRRWELSAGVDGDRIVYAKFRDALSNESAASSVTVRLDASAPSGPTVAIVEAPLTNKGTVTVETSAEGASHYALRLDGAFTAADWRVYTAVSPAEQSEAVDLGTADGLKTVYARFRDAAGNETAVISATVEVDRVAPQGPRVSIAEKPFARTTQGTLSLSAVGAARMCVYGDVAGACDPSSAVSDWEPFQGQKVVTLTSTQGSPDGEAKTVRAVFADAAGNVSTEADDSTTFDAQAPTNAGVTAVGKVRSVVDGSDVEDQAVSFTGDAKLLLTAKNATRVAISNDPTMDCATARYFPVTFANDAATIATYLLDGGTGTKTVYACFSDEAGNTTAVAATDTIYLDQSAPAGAAFKVNGGATWTAVAAVELNGIAAADDYTGAVYMRFSNCGDFGNGAGCGTTKWITLAATYPTWALQSGDGIKTVYMKVRDHAGNEGGISAATVTLDGTAPEAPEIHIGQKPCVKETQVDVVLSVGDATRMCIYGDVLSACTDANPANWELFRSNKRVNITSSQADPDGELKTVRVKFADEAGNVSAEKSDSTTYDAVAPTTGTPPVTIKGKRLNEVSGAEEESAGVSVDPEVNVELRASNASHVALSNSTMDCRSAGYVPVAFTGGVATIQGWRLGGGSGTSSVYACFMDAAGNATSSPVSDAIYLDQTPPVGPYLTVNFDEEFTSSETVDIDTIYADDDYTGEMYMKISNCFDFGATGCNTTGWLAMADSYGGWVLKSGDGPKSVFIKVRDYAGHEGLPGEDEIVLDKTAPTAVSLAVNYGDPFTPSLLVNVTLNATGDVKGMQVACDLGYDLDLEPLVWYSDTYPCALDGTDGEKTVRARFYDAAGNVSGTVSDTITLDQKPPTPPIFEPVEPVTSAAQVTLGLAATSYDENFGRYEIMGGPTYKDWTDVGASPPFTVDLYDNSGNLIQLRGVDQAGNVSSEDVLQITHDDTPPTAPEIFTADQHVNANTITVDLFKPSEDANFANYQLKGGPSYPDWSDTGAVSGFPFTLQQDAFNILCVRGTDRAGQAGPDDCVNITEDSTRPTAPVLMADSAWASATRVEVFLKQRATDSNFDHYEIRGGVLDDFEPICPDLTDLCRGSAVQPSRFVYRDGTDLDDLVAIAFDVRPGETTTLYLRAVDRAGNVGTQDSMDLSERTDAAVSATDYGDDLLAVHGDTVVASRPYPTPYDAPKAVLLDRGFDGVFGTDDDWVAQLSGGYVRSVAAFETRVAWTDSTDDQLFVATAGPDRMFGNADDCRAGVACPEKKVTDDPPVRYAGLTAFAGGIVAAKWDAGASHMVMIAPGPNGEFDDVTDPGNDDVVIDLTTGPGYDDLPAVFNQTLAFLRSPDGGTTWDLMALNPGADGKLGTPDDDLQTLDTGVAGVRPTVYAPLSDYTPETLNVVAYARSAGGPAMDVWVVEAGPDGRFDASDVKKTAASTPSFYNYALYAGRLAVNLGSNGINVYETGPDFEWGTADDPPPVGTSVLAGQFVRAMTRDALYRTTFARGNSDVTSNGFVSNRWIGVMDVPFGLSEPALENGVTSFTKGSHGGIYLRDFAGGEERLVADPVAWGSALSGNKMAAGGWDKNPYVVQPGADGILATADDDVVSLSLTGTLVSPVNPTMKMRSVGLDGDLAAWVDDNGGCYEVWIAHAGADAVFGTVDDCAAKVTAGCITEGWVSVSDGRVWWADAGGSFIREAGAGGVCDTGTQVVTNVAPSKNASLSSRRLAYVKTTGIEWQIAMIETADAQFSTPGDNSDTLLTTIPLKL